MAEQLRPAQVVGPALADAAGEHPLAEGPPHQGAQSEAFREGQHLAFDAPVEDRVRRLLGAEAHQAAAFGGPLGGDEVRGRGVRGPEGAYLPGADQVGQDREGLLHVRVRVGPVDLVEVDVVGAQTAQRVLDGGGEPTPGGTLPVGVLTRGPAGLGGEDDVVTAALERLADDLLRVAVGVGGVDDVDARVEGLVNDPHGVRGVGVADPGGEHQRAQGVGADLDPGPAEGAVPHGMTPGDCRTRRTAAPGHGQASTAKRKSFPLRLYGKTFRFAAGSPGRGVFARAGGGVTAACRRPPVPARTGAGG